MNKKKTILLILLGIFVILGIVISLIYFFEDKDDKLVKNEYEVDIYNDDNLPKDDGYDDNERIYGGWSSEKTEIYRDGKLVTTLVDNGNKVLQIYNNDKLDACYIDIEKNSELICTTVNYSLTGNMLYVTNSEIYLSGKRKVILDGDNLILKASIGKSDGDYSLLYLVKN